MTSTNAQTTVKGLFEQGNYPLTTMLDLTAFKEVFWKEAEDSGEPSAQDTAVWLETLCLNVLEDSSAKLEPTEENLASARAPVPAPAPAASSSSSSSSSSAETREADARKRRSEYLKKKVDPVFVPLLDALVHHQPEDVESFIVERLQASIRRRGGEGGGGGDDLVAAASGV